jgi:DNA-binding MarR family transcriptional regulator
MSALAPDEVVHQSMRLRILATLHALPHGGPLEFVELKALLAATDGNLGTHLATLEKAGYVTSAKDFVGRKPRTQLTLTPGGRRAFDDHVAYLRSVIAGAAAGQSPGDTPGARP